MKPRRSRRTAARPRSRSTTPPSPYEAPACRARRRLVPNRRNGPDAHLPARDIRRQDREGAAQHPGVHPEVPGSRLSLEPSAGVVERPPPPRPKTPEAPSSCATATSARGSTSSTSPRRSPRPGRRRPAGVCRIPRVAGHRLGADEARGETRGEPVGHQGGGVGRGVEDFWRRKVYVGREGRENSRAVPVALVGQSAGASTATGAPGSFAARVAIAGFRPPPSEERERVLTLLGDPLLVVASPPGTASSLCTPRTAGCSGRTEGSRRRWRRCRRSLRGSTPGDCWIRFGRGTFLGGRL